MLRLSLFVLVFTVQTASFAAVQSETISSIYHGGTPFMVVMKTDNAPEQLGELKPGLYKKQKNQWQLFIPGAVLSDDRKGPLVYQLAVTKSDDRFTSLMVIDGQLTMVTANSESNDPATFLQLGSQQFPLYEIDSQQKRYLPKITKPQNISLYQMDSALDRNGSQLVMVSVQFEEPTPIGNAITFIIGVKPNRGSDKLELVGRPYVIDHEFREPLQLQRLLTLNQDKDTLIFSKNLFDQLLNTDVGVFNGHTQFVNTWIQELDQQLSPEVPNYSKLNLIRAYNFSQQKIGGDSLIQFQNNIGGAFNMTQVLDIKSGVSRLVVDIGRGDPITFNGTIDSFSDKPGDWKRWTSKNNLHHLIFSKDNKLQFVNLFPDKRSAEYRMRTIEIGSIKDIFGLANASFPIENNQEFHFTSFESQINDQDELAIIFSVRNSTLNQGLTGMLRLRIYDNETIVNQGLFTLTSFFIPEDQLETRVIKSSDDQYIFDTLTPDSSSPAAYRQSYDPSKPHLSLLGTSRANGQVYRFNQPSKLTNVVSGISYATFNSVPNIPNPTGLYFATNEHPEVTGNEENRVFGQILQKNKSNNADEDTLFLAHHQLQSSKGDAYDEYISEAGNESNDIYLFAVDANRSNGDFGYNLVVATNYDQASDRYKFKTISLSSGPLAEFSSLNDISFIRGRYKNDTLMFIVLSFKNKDGLEKMAYVSVPLNHLERSQLALKTLSGKVISSKELGERIAFDDVGLPHFIVTPELPEDSVNFTLHSFAENKLVFPNQNYGAKRSVFKIGAKIGSELSYFVPFKDSWRAYASEIEKKLTANRSKEVEEFESFVDLKKHLDRLANPDQSSERMIIVVPQSLRNLVWEFILGLYVDKDSPNKNYFFNRENSKTLMHVFDASKGFQQQFFENLKSMNRAKEAGERAVLLSRMDELLRVKNPESSNGNAFVIVDVAGNNGQDLANVGAVKESKLPHALYFLAAGAPLSLEDFRKNPPQPNYSTVVLATPEELIQLDQDARSEIDFGMLNAFHIKEIRSPDQDSMALSIEKIFESQEIKTLDYKFSGKEIRPRSPLQENENLSVIVDYAISRFNALVEQKRQSLFESFMRFRAAFAAAVVSDRQVRQSRVINKFFVERVLNQVFDIPLNLETLPPDDPIRLLSRSDAVIKLQEAGYSGPFDLKTKVIRTVLSQTLADAGKPIPSSTILFGETGAGKTFMFVSLIKMLGLQLYDWSGQADNSNASAIILNVGKIVEGTGDGSNLTVSKAIQHLNYFMSQNNGYRGWILIDDVHAASDKVKGEILTWLRGTFEAPGGMYTTPQGIRRPVRNLNIFMTLNPTADQEQIGRFAKNKALPTTEELLLATLSTSGFKVEPSFLRRWNSIINLNYMPVGAKGPELIKSLAEASKNLLNSHSKIALVDPTIVRKLVTENEKLDARSFLSASTSSLIDMASRSDTPGSVALIVPTMRVRSSGQLQTYGMDGNPTERIDGWVNDNTRVLSLDSGLDGNLALMQLLVNAFRTPIYEFLISALQEDIRFSGNIHNQKALLAPVLAAIADHLEEHSDLPLSELPLKPSEFRLTTVREREAFDRAIQSVNPWKFTPHFPVNFGRTTENSNWKDLYDGNTESSPGVTRRNIIADTISLNHQAVERHLRAVLKVNALDEFPDPFQWLMHLTPGDQQSLKKVGKDLTNTLWDYFPKMFAETLIDISGSNTNKSLSVYGATRLFLYSIDKAVSQLPWVSTNRFVLHSLDLITQDQVLSQKSGVQSFLFTDRYRLLKPTITDLAFQMIANSPVVDTIPVKTRENLRNRFKSDCESYLTPPTGN